MTPCREKKQEFLQWLEQKRLSQVEALHESGLSHFLGDGNNPTPVSPCQPSPSDPITRTNKRPREDETGSAKASNLADIGRVGARKRKKHTNDEFAAILINRAKKGMAILKGKEKGNLDTIAVQAIVARSQQLGMADHDLDTILGNLEKEFMKCARHAQGDMKPKVWVNWYYAASFRFTLYQRGRCRRDRRASGVELLHRILNILLARIGIKALAVIAAYAGTTFLVDEKTR